MCVLLRYCCLVQLMSVHQMSTCIAWQPVLLMLRWFHIILSYMSTLFHFFNHIFTNYFQFLLNIYCIVKNYQEQSSMKVICRYFIDFITYIWHSFENKFNSGRPYYVYQVSAMSWNGLQFDIVVFLTWRFCILHFTI